MSHLRYDTTLDGRAAVNARVPRSVAVAAMQMPQLLRRTTNWSAIAVVGLTCGFPTTMKVHERRPQEDSS
jgi:hypothetical protein